MTTDEVIVYLATVDKVSVDLVSILTNLLEAANTAVLVAEYDPPERRFAGYRGMKRALDALAALDLVNKPHR